MTIENYEYRTNPMFLRNQFASKSGRFGIPMIPKPQLEQEDLNALRLLRFDQVARDETAHRNRMVHFFIYDYLFEKVWENPDRFIEMVRPYRAVLTPDFSMYTEMPESIQLFNTFRNRWCGAYFAAHGIRVIPTVNWGEANSFEYCFEGIERGSAVAVSTYMFQAHGYHADQKELFMAGYREMLRRIEPEYIICYSEPFPEMEGNIIYVDYELSSWKHMEDDAQDPLQIKHTYLFLTTGAEYDTIIKMGYVCKGGGSARGGEWQPKKPADERFKGKPGEIKETTIGNGYTRETLIGKDGRAVAERHWTDHGNPALHTIPHDHEIDWSNGYPDPSPPINYPDGNYPDLSSFQRAKSFHISSKEKKSMIYITENDPFESISDFKWCMKCHGEVQFDYQGTSYSVTHTKDGIIICKAYQIETALISPDVEDILDYLMDDGKKLREVITEVDVTERTI